MIRKLLLYCWLVLLLAWPSLSQAYPVQYDPAFRHWGQFYFPWDDWKHWKAQGLAESGLNPMAKSYCGAVGLMQIMAATAKGLGVNPYDFESNIQGGIKYDAQLIKYWKKIVNADDRRNFTYASYNAGTGWIIKARKLAVSDKWEVVALKLPLVTGKNAKQTQDYVKHINTFYWQIR